jgi:ABC-type xylose transport system permease subunit
MSDQHSKTALEEDLCIHIFAVSAAMVGVCLTVIGLIRIVITLQSADTLADDLLSVDALLFVSSCFLSYWALRTRKTRRMHNVERLADFVFLLAMLMMTAICLFITYTLAVGTRAVS